MKCQEKSLETIQGVYDFRHSFKKHGNVLWSIRGIAEQFSIARILCISP